MKRFLSFVIVALTLMGLAACGGSGGGNARLRILHASPDAPNLDLLVDKQLVVPNLPYEDASAYLNVESGTRQVRVQVAGTSTILIDAAPVLDDGKDYTIIAANLLAQIEPLLITDDNTPPPSGKFKIRFIHASPSAGNVDVYVTVPNLDITALSPNLPGVSFKQFSDYFVLDSGDFQIRVTPAGNKIPFIDTGALTFGAGFIRTAVVLDKTGGGGPLELKLLSDN
jgi:uncharacterized protein DUF4397